MMDMNKIKRKMESICDILEFMDNITGTFDELPSPVNRTKRNYFYRQLLISSVSIDEAADTVKEKTKELRDLILSEIVADEKERLMADKKESGKSGESEKPKESQIPPEVLEETMNFFLGDRKTKRG